MKLEITRRPIDIDVTLSDDNTWTVTTQLYTLKGIKPYDFETVVGPFAGMTSEFKVTAYDKDIEDLIKKELISKSSSGYFLDPMQPALFNYITNLLQEREAQDATVLKDIAKGKPIVYVGAGPSLVRDIPAIRAMVTNSTAIVIAGGTAGQILCKNGITPHFFIAYDSLDNEYDKVFKHLTEEWMQDTTLICYPYLNSKCFNKWSGDMIMFGGMPSIVGRNTLDNITTMNDGGSGVTTTAMNLASYMGADSIHLVGVDLADDNNESSFVYQREAHFISDIIASTGIKCYRTRTTGLDIELTKKRGLRGYKTPINFGMDCPPHNNIKYDDIVNTFKQMYEDINEYNSDTFANTAVFQTILSPYEDHAYFRSLWTQSIDTSVTLLLCSQLLDVLYNNLINKGVAHVS